MISAVFAEAAVSFTVALIFGFAFGALMFRLSLPVPAPPTVAGVLGVIGSVLGIFLAMNFMRMIA